MKTQTQPNLEKAIVSVKGRSVHIEMVCSDEYEARVFYDDVMAQLKSKRGLTIRATNR